MTTANAALGLVPGMGNSNNYGTRGMATYNPRQIMLRVDAAVLSGRPGGRMLRVVPIRRTSSPRSHQPSDRSQRGDIDELTA